MQIDQELKIEGEDLELWGIATYDLQGENSLDGDIGGPDGWEWTCCTILGFVDENFILSRDQLVFIFGEEHVSAIEKTTLETFEYEENEPW